MRLIFIAGSVYAVGGEFLFLFSTFPGAISKELGLSGYQRATLGSVVFLGMLVGNLTCCTIDSFGRKIPILVALFGMLVFAGTSAMATSFLTIVVLWILTGFSYGIGVPTWNALSSETSPTKWRFFLNGLSMAIFPVGSLHAAWLVFQYAPDLASVGQHWRTILLLERVPNIIYLCLGLIPGFVESPHYLAVFGRDNEAKNSWRSWLFKMADRQLALTLMLRKCLLALAVPCTALAPCLVDTFGRQLWSLVSPPSC